MRKILLLLSILIGIPLLAQTKQHISYTVKEGDTLENIAKVYTAIDIYRRRAENEELIANALDVNSLDKGFLSKEKGD